MALNFENVEIVKKKKKMPWVKPEEKKVKEALEQLEDGPKLTPEMKKRIIKRLRLLEDEE